MDIEKESGIAGGLFFGGMGSIYLLATVFPGNPAVNVGGISLVASLFLAMDLGNKRDSLEKKTEYERGLSDGYKKAMEEKS